MQGTDQNRGFESFSSAMEAPRKRKTEKLKRFLIVLAMLVATTVVNIFLERFIQPSSLIFIYLVPAIAGAIYYGLWASVLAFTAGFFIFDFFFVEPYYSLHISRPQDIYNITVYFMAAGLITYLINVVRRQNMFLNERLHRVSAMEDMTRDFMLLSPMGQISPGQGPTEALQAMVFSQLGQLTLKHMKPMLDVPALVFFRDESGNPRVWAKSSVDLELTTGDSTAAAWTLMNGEVSGAGTSTFPDRGFCFIPMKSLAETVGVIGISYSSRELFPEQRRLLGTIINLATMVASMWMNMKSRHG